LMAVRIHLLLMMAQNKRRALTEQITTSIEPTNHETSICAIR